MISSPAVSSVKMAVTGPTRSKSQSNFPSTTVGVVVEGGTGAVAAVEGDVKTAYGAVIGVWVASDAVRVDRATPSGSNPLLSR